MSNKLFIITKKTLKKDEPVGAFFEENMEKAKLYFQGWCWGQAGEYKLRWIGKFENQKLITCNVFITGSFEVNAKTNYEQQKINQLKMKYDFVKNEKKQSNQLKELYNGRYIK